MMDLLTPEAARALGALMEKERATPDAYPLTLNALVAACNQTSNRAPVMRLEQSQVEAAIGELRERGWLRVVHPSHGARTVRYRLVAVESLALDAPAAAVLCLLLLRGPQTPGELKNRSERLHPFTAVHEVQYALEALAEREEPLATRLPRRLGQKELRWAHLLCGEPDGDIDEAELAPTRPREDRLTQLEQRVAALEERLAHLDPPH